MRIICNHGFYKFYEEKAGEIAKFNSLYNKDVSAFDDYYTFSALKDFPEFSIMGAQLLDLPATATYCGKPWDILRENGFVYNFMTNVISPIISTGNYFKPTLVREFKYSSGLVLCGSFSDDGAKVTGYNCKFDFDSLIYKYSEFFYD